MAISPRWSCSNSLSVRRSAGTSPIRSGEIVRDSVRNDMARCEGCPALPDTRPAAAAASTRNSAQAAPPALLRQRTKHRRAQPIQPLVGVRLLRPFVEQLGKVADIPERTAIGSGALESPVAGVGRHARTADPIRPDPAARAANGPSPRSSDPPAHAAPSRNRRRGPRSAARARRQTSTGTAGRPWRHPRFFPRSRVRNTTMRSASPSL